jgi:glycosyltransferase involved in cell wall biosynthesis
VAVGQAGPSRAGTGRASRDGLAGALHALAQLPDGVGLELGCDETAMPGLELMTWAYGLDRRVELRQAAAPWAAWVREAERIPYDPGMTNAEMVEGLWPAGVESWRGSGDDHVLEGHRVAVVSNLPAHYRIPLFAGLSRRLKAAGGSLRVLFLRSSGGPRTWLDSEEGLDFEHEFVPGFDLPVRRRPPRLPLGLGAALRRHRPTIALSAGFSPVVSGRVQRYASAAGIPFGLWSGEIAALAAKQSWARQRQRQRLAERADFAIAYGTLAARYLAGLAPQLPVTVARNTSVVATGVPARRRPGQTMEVLTVGDLSSTRKGVDVLVEALRAVPKESCRLTVVGDGRVRKTLERQAAGDARVRFVGALPPAGVRAALAESDVFLFPSRADVFGLVLVEAMSRGLAIAVSSAVGAVPDVAVPGHNCLVMDTHDAAPWANALARFAGDAELSADLGAVALRTIARRWTMDHAVEGTLAGLRLGARLAAERRQAR